MPQTDDRRNDIVVTIDLLSHLLDRYALVGLCILKNINAAEAVRLTVFRSLLAEVLTNDGDKVIEMLLILQLCHLSSKVVKSEFFIL